MPYGRAKTTSFFPLSINNTCNFNSTLNSISISQSTTSNILSITSDLGNNDYFMNNQEFTLSKNNNNPYNIFEEIYTREYQEKYFLEVIPSILLDSICNEYSIFYINYSEFPISQSYQIFENNIVLIVE